MVDTMIKAENESKLSSNLKDGSSFLNSFDPPFENKNYYESSKYFIELSKMGETLEDLKHYFFKEIAERCEYKNNYKRDKDANFLIKKAYNKIFDLTIKKFQKKMEKIDEYTVYRKFEIFLLKAMISSILWDISQSTRDLAVKGRDSKANDLLDTISKDLEKFNKNLGIEEEQEIHSVYLAFMIDGTDSMSDIITLVMSKIEVIVTKVLEIFPTYLKQKML